MRIWAIGDTHGSEDLLIPPKDIDLFIFSGDCANSNEMLDNYKMVSNFISWVVRLDIKYKVFVAGNHDVSIERNAMGIKDLLKSSGIIYLENEEVLIENVVIWGSPITPTFGSGWAFNRDRGKIHKYWDNIPEYTDIVVTHGPPKGILDLTTNRDGDLEQAGCSNLRKNLRRVKPKFSIFGHIHNDKNANNQGMFVESETGITYCNVSVVTDGKFGQINNNGIILEI